MTLDDSTAAGTTGEAAAPSSIPTGAGPPRRAARAAAGLNEPDYDSMLAAHLLCFGRAVRKHFEVRLAQSGIGLTAAQARILMRLNYSGAMAQKAVADAIDVAPPTVAATVEIMERDGLISRQRNPADRRELLVELAERGRNKLPALFELFEALETWLTEGLSQQRVDRLIDELSVLRERLSDYLPCGDAEGNGIADRQRSDDAATTETSS